MESLTRRYKPKKPSEEAAQPPRAEKQLPSVEQVVKEAMQQVQAQQVKTQQVQAKPIQAQPAAVPVMEVQNTPLAVEPVALEVSAEEYEELEEISELQPVNEPEPVAKSQHVNAVVQPEPEPVAEMLDSSQEIFADDTGAQEKLVKFQSSVGRTQDVSVPIEVRVGPPGEEVRLQIVFELKIKVLPK
jgi:hypothetical protein